MKDGAGGLKLNKNILVLSEELEDTKRLISLYRQAGQYNISVVLQANHAVEEILKQNVDLLVYNVEEFNRPEISSSRFLAFGVPL